MVYIYSKIVIFTIIIEPQFEKLDISNVLDSLQRS